MTGKPRPIRDGAKLVEALYAEVDKAFDETVSTVSAREKRTVGCATCTKPACCNQQLLVNFLEILPIIASYDIDFDRAAELSVAMSNASMADWFAKQIPCMFLGSDGKCSIYPHRPLSCRLYTVLCDPSLCGVLHGTLVPSVNNVYLQFQAAQVLYAIGVKLGLNIGMFPTATLPWALTIWRDGMRSKSFVEHVESQWRIEN